MTVIALHDRARLRKFLARDRILHAYALGDLDDFFWPRTVWYGGIDGECLREVAFLYLGLQPPTLLAHTSSTTTAMQAFLAALAPFLPPVFHAHLSPGLAAALVPTHTGQGHGLYRRLALREPKRAHAALLQPPRCCRGSSACHVARLDRSHGAALEELYAVSYRENWFDPRMLETGYYFGAWDAQRLVSVAGIHVLAPAERVAALGNVTTHPDYRGRGLATYTCAHLCVALERVADAIAANVRADNAPALACYRRLGFAEAVTYEEWTFRHQTAPPPA